ncbi:MAG: carboxypeptidase regulatory-like domain-containing protein [Saprospiraceae bacterium]|nr:carboxypeptidase regulatory-like domain-containing protein [Saprospiraceae bacterium]
MKKIYFLFLMVFSSFALNAQVTNSTLSGKVTDSEGLEVIGATIQATHIPTGSLYGTTTNENGVFSIPNMRSGGPYKVEITYVGFQDVTDETVYLPLGSEFILNKTMNAGVALDEVEVVGTKSSIINSNRTGASTNLSSAQINSLPTISRSITDFTRMSPQAQGGSDLLEEMVDTIIFRLMVQTSTITLV